MTTTYTGKKPEGEFINKDGKLFAIIEVEESIQDKLYKVIVASEGATEEEIAKELAKEEQLSVLTVTTSTGKEFYADTESRIDLLSALMAANIVGQTETQWKLANGTIQTVTVQEIGEAMMLALQEKGNMVL